MLVRYPSLLDAGTVYEDPIGTVDVTPTLLGIAGIQADADFQGRDFTSRLRGEKKPSELEITFLRNAGTKAQWIAAIDARYKLVLSVNDRPWLFDLQTDPDELLNFYGRPGTEVVTRRLAAALKKYAETYKDPHASESHIAGALAQCLGESPK
jgi:arylsulfatase A-like enzyme